MTSARAETENLYLNFNGTFLGILGEADEHGLGFRVFVDGNSMLYKERRRRYLADELAPFGGGERFFWYENSDPLKAGRHTDEILPVFPKESNRAPSHRKHLYSGS